MIDMGIYQQLIPRAVLDLLKGSADLPQRDLLLRCQPERVEVFMAAGGRCEDLIDPFCEDPVLTALPPHAEERVGTRAFPPKSWGWPEATPVILHATDAQK